MDPRDEECNIYCICRRKREAILTVPHGNNIHLIVMRSAVCCNLIHLSGLENNGRDEGDVPDTFYDWSSSVCFQK
jgi:hypothetical protein